MPHRAIRPYLRRFVFAAAFLLAGLGAAVPARAASVFGLYRGVVVSTADPQQKGRLLVQIPAVLGADTTAWALPVLRQPYTIAALKLPKIGSAVWIAFEAGSPNLPVWLGGIP